MAALLFLAFPLFLSSVSGARLDLGVPDTHVAQQLPAGRRLAQAASPPPAAANNASTVPHAMQLSSLLAELGPGRPVTLKNVEAARFLSYAQAGARASPEPSQLVELPTGPVLVAWQNASAAAVIAFAANTSSLAFNASEPGFAPASVAPLLQGNFSGAYDTAASSPFVSLVNGSAAGGQTLQQLIANVSSGAVPRRIVCTGYGNGGALAELCGMWAAVTYPAAQIRSIAFGAPLVGNQQFAFAFQQLVDLSYLWSTASHLSVTNATVAGTAPADEVRVLDANNTSAGNTTSWDAYVQAIIVYYNTTSGSTQVSNSTVSADQEGGISGFINQVSSIAKGVIGIADNFGDLLDTVQAYAYRGDEAEALAENAETDAAAARANTTGCPPLLCKMRPAATASCNVYNNGSNTIAPGSVQIGPVNGTGTQLAVAWNTSASTAEIVFKGSTSREDWITDFKLYLDEANTNAVLEQFFPDVQLHAGFLQSFQSVTENAKTASENITAVLDKLSGGKTPTLVKLSGHSLGAGVASITAVWAALAWPAADIQVVTLGSPLPGNRQFAELFKLLVGRQQRMVNVLDVVPALPPLDDYASVDYGRWIPKNNTIVLESRPDATNFSDYNWNDHNCRVYEANIYRTLYTTAPADLSQALANTTTGSASAVGFTADAASGMSGAEGSGSSGIDGSGGSGSTAGTSNSGSGGSSPAPAPQGAANSLGDLATPALLVAAVAFAALL